MAEAYGEAIMKAVTRHFGSVPRAEQDNKLTPRANGPLPCSTALPFLFVSTLSGNPTEPELLPADGPARWLRPAACELQVLKLVHSVTRVHLR